MTKVEVRKSTQAIQEGISEVPKHQRPLTVDEMLLLKKQEMLTKRQN